MEYHCVLCGRETVYEAQRPGTLALCAIHAHLEGKKLFTEEEAYREGKARVATLTPGERRQEWEIAKAALAEWEPEVDRVERQGLVHLASFGKSLIAAKKAYLRAFEEYHNAL